MTSLHQLTAATPGLPCRTTPDAWFSPDHTERRYAARECHRCPLLLDCMRYALAADERYGVWGGVDFGARAAGCGTQRGFRVHQRLREPQCEACQAAHDEVVEAGRRRRLDLEHGLGGSVRGYQLHLRLGEVACAVCKGAQARQSADRRARNRRGREGPRVASVTSVATEEQRGAHGATQSLAAAA